MFISPFQELRRMQRDWDRLHSSFYGYGSPMFSTPRPFSFYDYEPYSNLNKSPLLSWNHPDVIITTTRPLKRIQKATKEMKTKGPEENRQVAAPPQPNEQKESQSQPESPVLEQKKIPEERQQEQQLERKQKQEMNGTKSKTESPWCRVGPFLLPNTLFSPFSSSLTSSEWFSQMPVADVKETQDGFDIQVELPGMKKEEVSIEYSEEEGLLKISGEKRVLKEINKKNKNAEKSSEAAEAATPSQTETESKEEKPVTEEKLVKEKEEPKTDELEPTNEERMVEPTEEEKSVAEEEEKPMAEEVKLQTEEEPKNELVNEERKVDPKEEEKQLAEEGKVEPMEKERKMEPSDSPTEKQIENTTSSDASPREENLNEVEDENDTYLWKECCFGRFERNIALPKDRVKGDMIKASFKNGMLRIHVPTLQKTVTKKIDIV